MPIPSPRKTENESEFMQRCMSDEVMINEYPLEQRAAICRQAYSTKMAGTKVSFDYDGTLSKASVKNKALALISKGVDVYIISARDNAGELLQVAKRLGIPESRVYATGSNEAKVAKVKELGITTHYDNNINVVRQLPGVGAMIS